MRARRAPSDAHRPERALAHLVAGRELGGRSLAVAGASCALIATLGVLAEQSVRRDVPGIDGVVVAVFGVGSVVPWVMGVAIAWLVALRIMRRVADDAAARWLDPVVASGGGGSADATRSRYVAALWMGAVASGVVAHLCVAAAVAGTAAVAASAETGYSARFAAGTFGLLCDSAAYAMVIGLIVQRRGLAPATAILVAGVPFGIVMLEVAGHLAPIRTAVRWALTVHLPTIAQRGPWTLVVIQLVHAALLLSIALWIAPRRVARGG